MPSRCVATVEKLPIQIVRIHNEFRGDYRESGEVLKVQKNRASAGKSVTTPLQVNIDVLGGMSDEDLNNHIRSLHEGLDHMYETRGNNRPWEEEIAYARREQQIRRDRRAAHEAYMKQLEREFSVSEAGLPVADLDNSAFLEINNR